MTKRTFAFLSASLLTLSATLPVGCSDPNLLGNVNSESGGTASIPPRGELGGRPGTGGTGGQSTLAASGAGGTTGNSCCVASKDCTPAPENAESCTSIGAKRTTGGAIANCGSGKPSTIYYYECGSCYKWILTGQAEPNCGGSVGGTGGMGGTGGAGVAGGTGGAGAAGGAGALGGLGGKSSTGGSGPVGGTPGAGGATTCGDPLLIANYPACRAAADSTACTNLGGTWGKPSPMAPNMCLCQTGQKDCVCTKDSDCLEGCFGPAYSFAAEACNGVQSGTCAAAPQPGCFCRMPTAGQPSTGKCVD